MKLPYQIRCMKETECAILLSLIKELAVYERLLPQVIATEQSLYQAIFIDKHAHVFFVEVDALVVGFALYFYNFSTFIGKKGLYLEDLYVKPEYRHQGLGKALFQTLIDVAKTEHCGRMEWSVLDWNESAITFYKCLGANPMSDWTVYRLTEEQIQSM